jgi:hypothetical protein
MVRGLVLDLDALMLVQQGIDVSEALASNFDASVVPRGLNLTVKDDIAYLLSSKAKKASRLLLIRIEPGKLFTGIPVEHRLEAFHRTVKAAISYVEPTVLIPHQWRPFEEGSIGSFHSNSRATGETTRVLMDRKPKDTHHIYAFGLTAKQADFDASKQDWAFFQAAIAGYDDLIDEANLRGRKVAEHSTTIDLIGRLPEGFTHGLSVKDWYESKLTRQQRAFVDFPLTQSVKMRGPAGTGKTVALIIKFMMEIYARLDSMRPFRYAFITHSTATVDLVQAIIFALDERHIFSPDAKDQRFVVTTLLDLANESIAYDLHDLAPLSTDGREGRILQMEVIQSLVRDYRNSVWITKRVHCSDEFKAGIEAELGSRLAKLFSWELMNEFACVLDAEGVRDARDRRERYIKEQRRNWMMRLETREERLVVLDLYTAFRDQLREMMVVGVDQMISDYLGYLDSFRWDAIRHKQGYDAIFVDELHLFNRQERMVFHHLMRDQKAQPVVLMAYDAKQSPRDTFMRLPTHEIQQQGFWQGAKLGNIEQIDLVDVFRYTPEIAEFLHFIDQQFPAVDLEEEWLPYNGKSQLEHGPRPILVEVPGNQEQYDVVFPRAIEAARRLGEGRRVAVLCLNFETFELLLGVGRYQENFVAVQSREQLSDIRYARKRFIFSMPEYVAGLQFNVVFLLDANKVEGVSLGERRRFISNLYLAASRAERWVEIYARRDLGGATDVLNLPVQKGALIQKKMDELPKLTDVL